MFSHISKLLLDNRFKGCGCTIFCDISQKTYKSINNMRDFNYYIAVASESGDNLSHFSAPILINKPITRTAFGISLNETNVIISLLILELVFSYL